MNKTGFVYFSRSFGVDASVVLTDCLAKAGQENGIFIVCSDLSTMLLPLTESSLLAAVKPSFTTNSVFTAEERGRLRGRETKVGGTEGSLLFYWHPHATGAVHLQTGGEDHALCGLTELPCSTLSQAMSNLKEPSQESETPEVLIDSDLSLTSPLLSTATKWILRGSPLKSLTIENEAQISIKKGVSSSLTLATLSIVFGTDSASRTTPILDVESGTIEINECSVNSDSKSISSSLFAVGGGSLILTKGSIATPSSSHPLVSITSGSFSTATVDVIVTVQPIRSSPLISMSGGTSSISGPITSLISSHAAFSLSGTAILKLISNTDFSNGAVGSVVTMDGGMIDIESSSFEHATLSSSLISGSGSMSIVSSSFTSLVESTTSSSNAEGVRALTLSIGTSQKVEIGALSKPVAFTLCSSRAEGGALLCTLSGSGILSITHTTFDKCTTLKDGGACFVDLTAITTGSFTTGDSVSFTNCQTTNKHGNELFVVCSDLQSFLTPTPDPSPLASIKPTFTTNTVFTDEQRQLLWGRGTQEGGSEGSLLFYWHPHTTGAVYLQTGGEDHVLCGLTELPCSTLSQAMNNLKVPSQESETPEVSIDSAFTLTSPLLSTATKWILRGSPLKSLTIENEAQISIKKGESSSLTLDSLSIVFGTDSASRTTPILDVQSGTIEMKECSVNSDTKSISSSLFAVGGGSLFLTKGSIATPSSSHPLVSITSGSFSTATVDVIVTVQPIRSSPLISMSGGTSSISGPITSLISSHAAFSLTGTAILKLKSNSDLGDSK
ncbi:hypothetical protein BLNAU_9130 [Blattamonas nauphoetae]|uniref:Uncharacterized protein n=1 Tax=Blattamonas nauphoetae TaxID=2049346 RepID=A0ABQ9XWY2_9EUKA|nr:hypothetical protein BLNAU_9130 [Blattamonas nauphoetae]